MSKYFNNKIVWITGASSGIGRALAIELSKKDAFLILTGRDQERLESTQKQLKDPNKSKIIILDLVNTWQLEVCSQSILKEFGHIDILINNAGVSQRSKIVDTSMNVYRDLMEVNYFGLINLTKLILPNMLTNGSGQIVVISSVAGKIGAPLRSGYSAAKHALHGFFDCLRAEHSKDNIKVNIICPGYTKTNIASNALIGNGAKFTQTDDEISKGMDPNILAAKIIKAVEHNTFESYFGGKEIKAIYLKRFFPKLLQKLLIKRNQ